MLEIYSFQIAEKSECNFKRTGENSTDMQERGLFRMNAKNLRAGVKRGLSLLLVLVMLLSFVPMQAFAYEEIPQEPTVAPESEMPAEEEPPVYPPPIEDEQDEVPPADVPMEPSVTPEPFGEIGIVPFATVFAGDWQELRDAVNNSGGAATTIVLENDILLTGAGVATADGVWDAIVIPAGYDITLTGGYMVQRMVASGTAAAAIVNNRHFLVDGTLTLQDVELNGSYPAVTGTTIGAGNHGGIEVRAGGSLYMEDGSAIRNNRNAQGTQGGAVTLVGAGANFTMDGGEISGNSALNISTAGALNGTVGGVFVGNLTTFTMNGGVIRNNYGRLGGGVAVGTATGSVPDTRMYMHGGEIYYNTGAFGGGVNVERGTLTMTDGEIHYNRATGLDNNGINLNNNRGGGGVFIQNNGIVNMEGGEIHTNRSYNHGGGVMLDGTAGNRFNMTGGTIRDNEAIFVTGTGLQSVFIPATGGGVRINNGIFTMGQGALGDSTPTYGTITGNTATNHGGGIMIWQGTSIANARLNLEAGVGEISNNTSLYGDGGGIFTVSVTGGNANIIVTPMPYPASLLAAHYPNIIASAAAFGGITFSRNVAGGGRFAPPLNPQNRPFGNLLDNYHINYRGENPEPLVTFILDGGSIASDPTATYFAFPIPLGGIIDAADVPVTTKMGYDFTGWIRVNDPTNTLLTAEDIEDLGPITGSVTFVAQWVLQSPVAVTYLPGTNGTFPGGVPGVTENLPSIGGNPIQIPTPIASPGWVFDGWSSDGGVTRFTTDQLMATLIDANVTFTAQWRWVGIGGWTPPPQRPYRQAYLIGTEAGLIRPHANITRAEVATIFFRLISDTDRAQHWEQTNPFPDVELHHWFNNAVSTATRMGIFQGRPDGTFGPNEAITRAELSAAAARFMDAAGIANGEDLFNDIYGHWANAYINVMGENNWVQGPYGQGGAFYPNRPITRAETAAIINRIFERLPQSTADLLPDMLTWPDNANAGAWYHLYLQAASNSYTFEIRPGGVHERWISIIPVRNWAALERPDSTPTSR